METAKFYQFIIERENIRLRKEAGCPFPWTDDPILQQYKFTNVFREYDRTTKQLIDRFYHTYGKNAAFEQILINCALYRYFGTYEFANAVGWQTKWNPKHVIKIAKERQKRKQRVFTGAYIVTNAGRFGPKEEVVTNIFLTNLWENRKKIVDCVQSTNNWQKTTKLLMEIEGFGGTGFMAKETLLDTMHCNFWKGGLPDDYWSWTPIGPGARRGINRLLNQPVDTRMTEKDMLEVLLTLTESQKNFWPQDWRRLAPTDQQFACCEYSKYLKVKLGEGHPRSKYRQPS